jgi:hypothetical protein
VQQWFPSTYQRIEPVTEEKVLVREEFSGTMFTRSTIVA